MPSAIAVHELSGRPGLPPLLISHATGFCGHAYAPIAEALRDRFHCFAVDHRGHGATPPPYDWTPAAGVDWRRFGDDTLEVARRLAPDGGLVGFGHSMGGATLLMAAHRDPGRFERLVLFEPIAHPETAYTTDIETVPLVVGARRRRRSFASFDEAFENFRSKPPLSEMTVEALRGYVAHGLRPAPGGGVELCCPPEFEAATFVASRHNGVWELLPDIEVPVLVLSGVVEDNEPSAIAAAVAERLPHGRSIVFPEQRHLGPFSHPVQVAEAISRAV